MNKILVEGLSVSIAGKSILHDINVSIKSDRLVGLIGPNGAGKSTLIRCLANLLRADRGRIAINDQDIQKYSRRNLAKEIAYLPQGHLLHWPLDVEHLVSLGRLPHLSPFSQISADDESIIKRSMEITDTLNLSMRDVNTLSGGERARAMLARALAVDAPILLADEPVASLDPYHQLQVMELMRSIAESDRLVVVVLHDLPLAARFCDRLILLAEGRIVADGPPEQVLDRQYLGEAYNISGIYGMEDRERFVLPWRRLSRESGKC